MLVFKLKRNLATQAEIISTSRIIFNIQPRGKFNFYSLRRLVYSHIYTKQSNGVLILQNRLHKIEKNQATTLKILDMIKWFGISWNEEIGLFIPEKCKEKTYFKEERQITYHKYLKTLLENDDAYYCFCSEERLKELRNKQRKNKQELKYDKICHNLSENVIKQNLDSKAPYRIRARIHKGKTKFNDLVFGEQEFENNDINDRVLLDENGKLSREIMNVVDNHLIKATHMIEEIDMIQSSQTLNVITKLLDLPKIQFIHLPKIKDINYKNLKNEDLSDIFSYKNREYFPEALLNFTVSLGWTPKVVEENVLKSESKGKILDKDIYNMEELLNLFTFDAVSIQPVACDIRKIEKFNRYYLLKYFSGLKNPQKEFPLISKFKEILIKENKECEQEIRKSPPKYIKDLANLMLNYITNYKNLTNLDFFFIDPNIDESRLEKFTKAHSIKKEFIDQTLVFLTSYIDTLQDKKLDGFALNKKCSEYLYENRINLNNHEVFQFLKYVLTGVDTNLLLSEICEVLGKPTISKRIKMVQEVLNQTKDLRNHDKNFENDKGKLKLT